MRILEELIFDNFYNAFVFYGVLRVAALEVEIVGSGWHIGGVPTIIGGLKVDGFVY